MFSTTILTRLATHIFSKPTILISTSRTIFSSDTHLTPTSSLTTTTTDDKTTIPSTSSKTDHHHDVNFDLLAKMRSLRTRNPYALFVKVNYNDFKTQYPNLKMTDISKKIGEIWKKLPDQERQVYIQQTQDQKILYEKEKNKLKAVDLHIVVADEKAKKIQKQIVRRVNALPTKKPRSAYALYLHTLQRGETDLGTYVREASKRWKQMSEQDKQPFFELHNEEKQKYLKELVAWSNQLEKHKPAPTQISRGSQTPKTIKPKRTVRKATRKTAKASKLM